MKIIVSRAATLADASEQPIKDVAQLQKLDGLTYDGDFVVNYLEDPLDELELQGGAIKLAYNRDKGLRVVTEFLSPRKLKKNELAALQEQTVGQWSDGVGGDCFDEYERTNNVRLNLFPFDGGDAVIEQVESDVKMKPKAKSRLLTPAFKGDLEKVRKLIDKGEDINGVDNDGSTPLILACIDSHTEVALLLIERGADLMICDKGGECALHFAAQKGLTRVVEAMIARGMPVDVPSLPADGGRKGDTPLMRAAGEGRIETVKALVAAGADIKKQSPCVLMFARYYPGLVQWLLENGADPTARNSEGESITKEIRSQVGTFRPEDLVKSAELIEQAASKKTPQ